MSSPEERTRERAVRTLSGKLRGRPFAVRRPDLVSRLTQLFYSSLDAHVRGACVDCITEMAEDGAHPKPLFDALSDADPGVILHGIFALTYFPDPRALDPLCRFIDSRANLLFNENAMGALGQIGDERAVPTLVKVLLDTSTSFDQNIGTAGLALGRCGPKGFDALVRALDHTDPRVRLAGVAGLDISGDPRATARLDGMLKDADQKVRDRAKVRMGDFYFRRT